MIKQINENVPPFALKLMFFNIGSFACGFQEKCPFWISMATPISLTEFASSSPPAAVSVTPLLWRERDLSRLGKEKSFSEFLALIELSSLSGRLALRFFFCCCVFGFSLSVSSKSPQLSEESLISVDLEFLRTGASISWPSDEDDSSLLRRFLPDDGRLLILLSDFLLFISFTMFSSSVGVSARGDGLGDRDLGFLLCLVFSFLCLCPPIIPPSSSSSVSARTSRWCGGSNRDLCATDGLWSDIHGLNEAGISRGDVPGDDSLEATGVTDPPSWNLTCTSSYSI